MGQISNSAIIVLCIVAAGFAVLIGWAIGHRVRNSGDGDDERAIYAAEGGGGSQPSQYAYMRDMRERYKEDILARFGSRQQRPRQHSIPLSGAPTSGPSDYSYY